MTEAQRHATGLQSGIGLAAGLLSGLLGVGGGVILVPAMVRLLRFSQHRAHGTSLAIILFTAAAGLVTYIRAGQIDWTMAAWLALGSIAGAAWGARLAQRLPAATLKRVFGAFMLLVAGRMLYDIAVTRLGGIPALPGPALAPTGIAVVALVLAIGVATGVLSGLLGVGGGIIMVPAMVFLLGFSQTLAQGISLAVIIPTAISGGLVHLRQGNIRLPDVPWLALGGVIGALLGALLALRLDTLLLRTLFALLLLVLGATMVRGRPTPRTAQ